MTIMNFKQEDIIKGLRYSADAVIEIKRVFTDLNANEDTLKGFDDMKIFIHTAADEIIRLNTLLHESKGTDDDK